MGIVLILVSSGYIIASFLAWFFPDVYIAELWISFLPYWMWGGSGIVLILWGYIYLTPRSFLKNICISLSFFVLLCVGIYGGQYRSFYEPARYQSADGEGLSFLYANIWRQNTHMSELYATISDADPDVILLVEYTPEQHTVIYPLLRDTYPYINTDYPESSAGGNVIYSKIPFTNLAPTLEGDARWKYGYVSMEYQEKEYIFYAVHTSAPISPHFLAMRNRQLVQLGEDITAHTEGDRYESRVVVVGDFNLSPRSPSYTLLETALGNSFTNIVKYAPGVFTRSLFDAWSLLRATIDHVRTTHPEDIQEMRPIDIFGSDHRGWSVVID